MDSAHDSRPGFGNADRISASALHIHDERNVYRARLAGASNRQAERRDPHAANAIRRLTFGTLPVSLQNLTLRLISSAVICRNMLEFPCRIFSQGDRA
jgi:hypothetical protein